MRPCPTDTSFAGEKPEIPGLCTATLRCTNVRHVFRTPAYHPESPENFCAAQTVSTTRPIHAESRQPLPNNPVRAFHTSFIKRDSRLGGVMNWNRTVQTAQIAQTPQQQHIKIHKNRHSYIRSLPTEGKFRTRLTIYNMG